MNFCGHPTPAHLFPDPLILPWFQMTDTRIDGIKAAGTLVLLGTGFFMMPGLWNGEQWVTESGSALDDPWKWMPMPEPVNT